MIVADQIAAVEKALDDIRYARSDSTCPEHAAYNLLKEYAAELRAQTPGEISRVLAGMTDQVDRARRAKAQLGFYEIGNAQAICESVCGRWWAVIRRALEQFEKETVT
jgi:hypothetical protein